MNSQQVELERKVKAMMLASVADTDAVDAEIMEQVLIGGDLSKLNSKQKLDLYVHVCRTLNLNPMTRPFEYIQLSGKLTLYARKDCTEQLRRRDNISLTIVSRELIESLGIREVFARAENKDGRTDESSGCVSIKGLTGEALANAFMRAETKAKRRVTLSICGLGFLDESEVSSIPDAQVFSANEVHSESNLVSDVKTEKKTSAPSAKAVPVPTPSDGQGFADFKEGPPKKLINQKQMGLLLWTASKWDVNEDALLEYVGLVYQKSSLGEISTPQMSELLNLMNGGFFFDRALEVGVKAILGAAEAAKIKKESGLRV